MGKAGKIVITILIVLLCFLGVGGIFFLGVKVKNKGSEVDGLQQSESNIEQELQLISQEVEQLQNEKDTLQIKLDALQGNITEDVSGETAPEADVTAEEDTNTEVTEAEGSDAEGLETEVPVTETSGTGLAEGETEAGA